MSVTVTLLDGSVVRGEHVGSQDGYVFLATDDGTPLLSNGVRRIEQKHILNWSSDE